MSPAPSDTKLLLPVFVRSVRFALPCIELALDLKLYRPVPRYLQACGKVNLDIFWLRDESLEDSANLPNPEVWAAEIVEDLRSALAQFESIEDELSDKD